MRGQGLEGFYQEGRRVLARCELRLAGAEPVPVQGTLLSAGRARFVAVARSPADAGPDPAVMVERLRDADGSERITVLNTGPIALRIPLEVALSTDLAELGAVAAGRAGPDLPASVCGSGLRWSHAGVGVRVTAHPAPASVLASAGLLRWDLSVPPGASRTFELRVSRESTANGAATSAPVRADRAPTPWSAAELSCDDARGDVLLRGSLDGLRALLLRDPARTVDVHVAAGAPWRMGLAPAEALWAARILLPLGTRLAAGTLRTLARLQDPDSGRIPGVLRHAGPQLPPSCSGVEATLLFVTVLAEARRWGLPQREAELLLPAAERCLGWLRTVTDAAGYVPDPAPGGPLRCEVQAHAHRAALHGADLLDAFGRPGAAAWREHAARLRGRFREDFWVDDRGGGWPAAALTPDGTRQLTHLGSAAAHLLDTGLLGGGALAPGLLDKVRTEQLARLLGAPDLDSGWGLRTLSARAPGHNPFGHRGGAVRVHETALAVSGLAAAGYEKEAAALLRGVIDAAGTFGRQLPEMYAGEQRAADRAPLPHPTACRPAAVAAAGAVHLLAALAGVRPDAPGGVVAVRPMSSAPLGAVRFSGLRVDEQPFAVRVSRLGMAMVEEAAPALQLGA
ncbi:glycogen debranching N-terminal domain-containing protein [Streptomyces sp. H10-C2]|uniref:glycogen debranching N-terminal domain-containing protein n=1 Tax=unclassified Streptomyces TaxID=2593676 RepID=UPI0024BB3B41|nr:MULTISPECIES: glycogen debranching N-terminal domain-containing protein [unclassified Streptomyces]MDJ0341577.1 glycogen debranching N-terminal domain-containing protein [Streptomyces sp. PH10-H1]MDJ0371321.1 glycogen debranching N-terminal domain-containing protein [Streptomyces sp. H10-C2]